MLRKASEEATKTVAKVVSAGTVIVECEYSVGCAGRCGQADGLQRSAGIVDDADQPIVFFGIIAQPRRRYRQGRGISICIHRIDCDQRSTSMRSVHISGWRARVGRCLSLNRSGEEQEQGSKNEQEQDLFEFTLSFRQTDHLSPRRDGLGSTRAWFDQTRLILGTQNDGHRSTYKKLKKAAMPSVTSARAACDACTCCL